MLSRIKEIFIKTPKEISLSEFEDMSPEDKSELIIEADIFTNVGKEGYFTFNRTVKGIKEKVELQITKKEGNTLFMITDPGKLSNCFILRTK